MKEKLAILLSYIDKEWKVIVDLKEKLQLTLNELKKNEVSEEKIVFGAFTLHNMYCAIEEIFKYVAKTFENNINDYKKYHSELLEKMNMDIYRIRPRLICENSFIFLNEMRKFRHVFRNAYEYEISEKRIIYLAKLVIRNWNYLKSDIENYRNFLKKAIAK